MAEVVVPLGNLGSHPLHLLANALVFDHYCHLRHDMLGPNGPVDRPDFPIDELRIAPILDWMLGRTAPDVPGRRWSSSIAR